MYSCDSSSTYSAEVNTNLHDILKKRREGSKRNWIGLVGLTIQNVLRELITLSRDMETCLGLRMLSDLRAFGDPNILAPKKTLLTVTSAAKGSSQGVLWLKKSSAEIPALNGSRFTLFFERGRGWNIKNEVESDPNPSVWGAVRQNPNLGGKGPLCETRDDRRGLPVTSTEGPKGCISWQTCEPNQHSVVVWPKSDNGLENRVKWWCCDFKIVSYTFLDSHYFMNLKF